MVFKDYYRILELNSNKVSIEQIKIAYRELAKKYHPDLNIGNKMAEERCKDINEAYTILSDLSSKKKYDRMWNNYIGNKKLNQKSKNNNENISNDFFSLFFGNVKEKDKKENVEKEESKTRKVPVKGENIETEIEVSIEEAFKGNDKKISLRTVDGKLKTFTIKVPAGIRDKEKIRLLGQGKSGQNGGKNGDLFIKINIKDDEQYKLEGYELKTYIELSPWEAALGTKVKVKCIDEEIFLHIPSGTQSGEKITIQEKGYKDGKGGRGNLITEIRIMVPRRLTDEEKELFEKLKKVSKYNPRTIKS